MKKMIKLLIIAFISLICSIKDVKATEIPKVYLEGNIENMNTKSDERKIKLTYKSENLNFNAYALIKIQGTSSLAYTKKNYTIKLYQDDEYIKKKKVNVGFGEENKYCLKANWIDKTHSRNIVTARIASDIQEKYNLFMDTPNNGLIDGFPVEIYINNEFLGLYTWNISKDSYMFNMDKDNPNHIVLSGAINSEATTFNDYATFNDWEVEVGTENEETLTKLNRLIDFVITSTDEEFKTNFENYFNLDATLNYYVMLNLLELLDNTSKNMLLVTYDGEIWYPSLYDLDTSFGTSWSGTSLYNYNSSMDSIIKNTTLWKKFKRNFSNEIANRYFELRKDILTKENILNKFNNFYNQIPESSLQLENNKWKNIPGYDFTQIEEFLDVRIPLIDKEMYNLYNDITPTVTIKYSSNFITIKDVQVAFIPNRNDILILKDGEKIDSYTYSFKKNGEYTFEYTDWYGNVIDSTTIKIDWIIPTYIIFIAITLLLTIIGIILYKKRLLKKIS